MESDLIQQIIKELKQRQLDFQDPGTYLEAEWYIKCEAKAEAFEEAILIIEEILKNK
jgi:hypothetical protein